MTAANGDTAATADPRQLIAERLRQAMRLVAGPDWDPARDPQQIRDMIAAAATAAADVPPLRPHAQVLEETFESLAGPNPALPTGFAELDDMIGGVVPGQMIVLGGLPGTMKTTLALRIADYLATELEQAVLYSSLEMSARELTLRRMSAASGVPLRRLQRYQMNDMDEHRIARVYGQLASTRLLIDDARHLPLTAMRARLAALAVAGDPPDPPRLHVVDHVGLVKVPAGVPRNEAMSVMVKGLRDTAEEFGVAVLVVSQLNRGLEARHVKDRRPQLGDLKGTGELEETADVVLLLHEEGTDLEVIGAKNRNGRADTIILSRQPEFARIIDRPWSPSGQAR